ncbi:MAG TPA: hypothetical protein VK979_04725, partial [Guyparkeria sp.]|nr:hypothetical protein [Guyparkeria sp.]
DICRHRGDIHLYRESDAFRAWQHGKQEREASIIASRLLIPSWALQEYGTEIELCAACDVPREALEYRRMTVP